MKLGSHRLSILETQLIRESNKEIFHVSTDSLHPILLGHIKRPKAAGFPKHSFTPKRPFSARANVDLGATPFFFSSDRKLNGLAMEEFAKINGENTLGREKKEDYK